MYRILIITAAPEGSDSRGAPPGRAYRIVSPRAFLRDESRIARRGQRGRVAALGAPYPGPASGQAHPGTSWRNGASAGEDRGGAAGAGTTRRPWRSQRLMCTARLKRRFGIDARVNERVEVGN